jgi:hypothetical protein
MTDFVGTIELGKHCLDSIRAAQSEGRPLVIEFPNGRSGSVFVKHVEVAGDHIVVHLRGTGAPWIDPDAN